MLDAGVSGGENVSVEQEMAMKFRDEANVIQFMPEGPAKQEALRSYEYHKSYVAGFPDVIVSSEDDALRQEAANIAGINVSTLPEAQTLKGFVTRLFYLLNEEGMIPGAKVIEICKMYDDRAPAEAIRASIESVGGSNGLTERKLYLWIIHMFGDCSEEEFYSGVTELIGAASNFRSAQQQYFN